MLEISPRIKDTLLQLYIFERLSNENKKIFEELLKLFNSSKKNKDFFETKFLQEKQVKTPNYHKESGLMKKFLTSEYLLEPSSAFDKITKEFGAKEKVFSDLVEYFSEDEAITEKAYHSLRIRLGFRKKEILRQAILQKDEKNWALDYYSNGIGAKNNEKIVGFMIKEGKITLKDCFFGFISFCAKLGYFDFNKELYTSLAKNDSFAVKGMRTIAEEINKNNLKSNEKNFYGKIRKEGEALLEEILALYSRKNNVLEIYGDFEQKAFQSTSGFSIEGASTPGAYRLFGKQEIKNFSNSKKVEKGLREFSPLREIKYYDSTGKLYLGRYDFKNVDFRGDTANFENLIYFEEDNSLGIYDFSHTYGNIKYMVQLKGKESMLFYNKMPFEESFKIFFGLAYPALCRSEVPAKAQKELEIFHNKLIDYNASLMFSFINLKSIIKIFSTYLVTM